MNSKKTNFSDISSWFSLDRYKNTATYDVIDWVTQLDNRIWLYDMITEHHWDCFGKYGWETLLEIAPEFLDFFGFSPDREEYSQFDDTPLPELSNAMISSVSFLTLSDIVGSYDAIKNKEYGYFVEQIRNEIDQFEAEPETEKSNFEFLYRSFDEQWVEDNEYHSGEFYLKVDLQSPNAKLKEEFAAVLETARGKLLTPDAPFFEKGKVAKGLSPENLLTKSILPLIDILIWEKVEGADRNDELRKELVFSLDEDFRNYSEFHPWVEKALDRRHVRNLWEKYKEGALRQRGRQRQINGQKI